MAFSDRLAWQRFNLRRWRFLCFLSEPASRRRLFLVSKVKGRFAASLLEDSLNRREGGFMVAAGRTSAFGLGRGEWGRSQSDARMAGLAIHDGPFDTVLRKRPGHEIGLAATDGPARRRRGEAVGAVGLQAAGAG